MFKDIARLCLPTLLGVGAGLLMTIWEYNRPHDQALLPREAADWIGAACGALAGLVVGLAWVGNVALEQKIREAARSRRQQVSSQ